MNALSALGILLGSIAGVVAAAFLAPMLLPYSKQATTEIEAAKAMSARVRGTVVSVDSQYIYLKKESETGEGPVTLKVRYDTDTLPLVRKKQQDTETAHTTEIALLTGPFEDIVREGADIYVTLWVTNEKETPYALMVFGTI